MKISKYLAIFIFIVFLIFFIYNISKLNYLMSFEFNNKDTKNKYAEVLGYSKYNENGISFLYPDDWIVIYSNEEFIYVENDYNNSTDDEINFIMDRQPYNSIKCMILSKDEAGFSKEQYNNSMKVTLPPNLPNTTKNVYDNGYIGCEANYMYRMNDKETKMVYKEIHTKNQDNASYEIEFMSVLVNDKILVTRIHTSNKDILEVIAGSLTY